VESRWGGAGFERQGSERGPTLEVYVLFICVFVSVWTLLVGGLVGWWYKVGVSTWEKFGLV